MKRIRVTLDIVARDVRVPMSQIVEFAVELGGQIAPPKMGGKTLDVRVISIKALDGGHL